MRYRVVGRSMDGRLELALGDGDWGICGSGIHLGWHG